MGGVSGIGPEASVGALTFGSARARANQPTRRMHMGTKRRKESSLIEVLAEPESVTKTYSAHVREVGETEAGDVTATIETALSSRIVLRGLSIVDARKLGSLLYRPVTVTITVTRDKPGGSKP
jgi:hypothetical protein